MERNQKEKMGEKGKRVGDLVQGDQTRITVK